jgi:hypothetical protein
VVDGVVGSEGWGLEAEQEDTTKATRSRRARRLMDGEYFQLEVNTTSVSVS